MIHVFTYGWLKIHGIPCMHPMDIELHAPFPSNAALWGYMLDFGSVYVS